MLNSLVRTTDHYKDLYGNWFEGRVVEVQEAGTVVVEVSRGKRAKPKDRITIHPYWLEAIKKKPIPCL